MLEKMGWKKGEGLGKDGGGMKDPVGLSGFHLEQKEQKCICSEKYLIVCHYSLET